MAVLERIEIWSDVECNTGARTGIIPRHAIISATEFIELNGREELELSLDPEHASTALVTQKAVLRPVYDDDTWDEYRVSVLGRARSSANQVTRTVLANSIKFDLQTQAPLVEFGQANWDSNLHHELAMISPSDYVDALVALTTLPSHFTKGTIDPTELRDFVMEWETFLSALTDAATVTSTELVIRRNGTTDYKIDLLDEYNSAADTPLVTLRKNALSLDVTEDSTEMGTLVYPRGEGSQGEAPAIGDTLFLIGTFDSGTNVAKIYPNYADFSGGVSGVWPVVMNEDDQYNDLYVRVFNYTTSTWYVWQITDSSLEAAPDDWYINVTVSRGADPAPPTGSICYMCRDSSGHALNYVPLPSAVATYGEQSYVIERADIPGVNNVLNDPFLEVGNVVTEYIASGATLSTVAAPSEYVHYGNRCVKAVVATAGGMMRRTSGTINGFNDTYRPTPEKPQFSFQTWIYVESGRVQFELWHVSHPDHTTGDPVVYPYGTDDNGEPVVLRTGAAEAWYHMSVEPGLVDFYDIDGNDVEIQFRWIALDDNTTFYVDAVQAVNEPIAASKIVRGSSHAQLWAAGVQAFKDGIGEPRVTLDINVLDLERLDGATYPYDEIDVGVTLLLRDPGLNVDLERRVFSVKRNLLEEALTSVELSDA